MEIRFWPWTYKKYGGITILTENLKKKKNRLTIKVSDPFIKEILEIWSELIFEQTIVSDDHFLSLLSVWFNSLIRIENKQDWHKSKEQGSNI